MVDSDNFTSSSLQGVSVLDRCSVASTFVAILFKGLSLHDEFYCNNGGHAFFFTHVELARVRYAFVNRLPSLAKTPL